MRTAVIDIGTNSTRLLIADVTPDGRVTEIVRRSVVTRLGAGVDAEGALSREACERVYAALAEFRAEIDAHRPTAGGDAGGTSARRPVRPAARSAAAAMSPAAIPAAASHIRTSPS